MTLILDRAALKSRRNASETSLAALTDSLAADLEAVMARPLFVPPEKAKLTRIGGQCSVDGTQLTFDPFSPREHECPRCQARYRGPEHYLAWITFYQQWFAERSVHAAALYAVRGDMRHRKFAETILRWYANAYATYPNSDNVLGPSRLFFSTYLESIWLLQLCVAIDLIELADGQSDVGDLLRDRVLAPASSLIRGYNEGDSNRQVWNNAALLASAHLLGDSAAVEKIIHGPYGLVDHLSRVLLADGTWYEGENYHQFAHRGLWYGARMAEMSGHEIPAALVARFEAAFAAPFLTALPDFTFPARRDSRHKVSLRQWRYAESCELGLARHDDDQLLGALHVLYANDIPRSETGRWRSAAESERNEPASALTRADLGWRSLLCARPELPALHATGSASVHMESQGLAIFRRDHGRIFAALDYGHTGGGHGHPDRLNVMLMDGAHRWLDDPGTGSYVEPTLHWYRSSLAHNAPMFGGQSQQRVSGTLIAQEDRGAAGWVRARVVNIAPGSQATRTLVAMPDYVVDVIDWQSVQGGWFDLPLHLEGNVAGARWAEDSVLELGQGDGFSFVRSAQRAVVATGPMVLAATEGDATLSAWITSVASLELWRLVAPGPPGEGNRAFFMVRSGAVRGTLSILWSMRGSVTSFSSTAESMEVLMADGSRHTHRPTAQGWQIELHAAGARSSIDLGGVRTVPVVPVAERRSNATPPGGASVVVSVPASSETTRQQVAQWLEDPLTGARWRQAVLQLGESHYRQSELPWSEAGAPTATISLVVTNTDLLIEIAVRKAAPTFAERRAWNALDNERADINSDGAQLYVLVPGGRGGSWLMVPEIGGSVRITRLDAPTAPTVLEARWFPTPDGYTIRAGVQLGEAALRTGSQVMLEVMVNEISPDRERRRGQLILSGGKGEFVYLQGDRHRGRWTMLRISND